MANRARSYPINRTKTADRWWTCKENEAHEDCWATLRRIRALSSQRLKFDRHHMELYSNQNVAGNGSTQARERVRFNLISQAVDTAASQIAVQRPKPMYLTTEGDFELQRQARLRTRVLEGQLEDLGAYEIMPSVFVDAAVNGSGFVYGYLHPDTNEPCIERCLPGTVWVDPRDGLRRDPLCIYYRIPIARDVLYELYPDVHEKVIADAEGPDPNDKTDMWLTQDSTCDDVMVLFAFRRKSTKKSNDGRLVISVSSGTLVDKEWEWSLPFVRYVWKERQLGYYGSGIAEAGRDPQARIMKMIVRGERLLDKCANTMLVLDERAKIRAEQITNAPALVLRVSGNANPPVFQTSEGKPMSIDTEVDRVREQFFSEQGISTMAAEAKKPAGLNSGAAQREYQDITSQRHQVQSKAFERAYINLCKLLEELNERASKASDGEAANDNGYEVVARTQRGRATMLKSVKWDAVRMPENKYRIQCWPTSQLPSTPAGKMAMVSEWIASGFISRPTAQQLMLDMPDTDAAARLELADMDAVMYDVERILDGYEAYPEPYQNLQMASDIARRAYLSERCKDAPESVLERLREYVNQCLEMQGLPRMDAPPQPQSVPAGGPVGPVPVMPNADPTVPSPGGEVMPMVA